MGEHKEEKMEFDKSRVYTALNADELHEGDKVIVADNLADLKEFVRKNDVHEIEDILSDCVNERFGVCGMANYALAYLVERARNCTNCGEGRWDAEHKKILCDPVNCGNGNVIFRNHEIEVCEYYKPITKQKAEIPELISLGNGQYVERKHYRPFRNTDELIKAWIAKRMVTYPDLCLPHIWVRRKEANSKGQLITEFSDELHVSMGKEGYNMIDLFLLFTFLDGSVCGVEE